MVGTKRPPAGAGLPGTGRVPAKQTNIARTNTPARQTQALEELTIAAPLAALQPMTVDPVPSEEQALFEATMAEHHPLGFRRAFGSSIRYWVHGQWEGQGHSGRYGVRHAGAPRGGARRMAGLDGA